MIPLFRIARRAARRVARRGQRALRLWALALSCALLLFFALATPAGAAALHAQYDHSDPAANARLPGGHPPLLVEIWFTEQIEPAFSSIQVYNQQKQRVDNNDSRGDPHNSSALIVSLHPHLPDGAYTVVFSNVSAEDGHHVQSSFGFVVGSGPLPSNTNALLNSTGAFDENFTIWSILVRWINYLSMAGLVGVAAFLLFIWRPTIRLARKTLSAESARKVSPCLEQRASSLLLGSLLVLLGGWAAFLLYQTSIDSGLAVWSIFASSALSRTLFQSRFGLIWLIRLGLIGGALLCWLLWSRFRKAQSIWVKRATWPLWLLLLLGVGIMFTTVLNSHSAANKAAWLLVPADEVHLLSTGFWIGGLLMLVSGIAALWRVLLPGTGERTRLLAILIPRFSRIALAGVVLLALTGGLQAIVQLGSFNALFTTPYGQALCVKIALFVLLICLGAYSLRRITPRMQSFASSQDEEKGANSLAAGTLQRAFRRTVGVEAGVMLLLLLVVGVLTSLSPPLPQSASASSSPAFLQQGQAGSIRYTLVINPGTVGINTIAVDLHDQNGQAVVKTDAVLVRLTMLDMQMGTQEEPLQPVAGTPGRYSGATGDLSMPGHWRITLLVRRTGFDDASATFPYFLESSPPAQTGWSGFLQSDIPKPPGA